MTNFAIIAEGPSDIAIIQNILVGYFNDPDIELNPLQPPLDATDQIREGEFGGWQKVFIYLQNSEFKDAFRVNDYIIIQIDTDVCDEYGIAKYQDGRELSVEELISQVMEKIREEINDKEFYIEHKDKIIYAISVHSVECWLLPLYADRKQEQEKTKNCQEILVRHLSKKNLDSNKNYKNYALLTKKYIKNKEFMKLYKQNPSLKVFVDNLSKVDYQKNTDLD